MINKAAAFLKNRSLGFKLSVSILLSILTGSFLLSIFLSNYAKPLLKEQVISEAYKALGGVNHNIAQGADITEQSLVNTVKILSLKESSNEKELILLAKAAHEAILEQYGHFYEFFIFIPSKDKNKKGRMYNSYIKNGALQTKSWQEHEYVKGREWFNEAVNTGKIHWTEPYASIDPERNVILSTTVSVPFKFKGSTSWDGVIGASGNLSSMQDYLKSLYFESGGRFLLTSAKGLYLIHPDSNIELKKTITELAEEMNSQQLKYTAQQVKEGKSGFIVIPKSSVYKGEAVFVYMPIPKTNWSSYLVYSSDDFYRPVKQFQLIMLSVTALGVLLLILLVNRICRLAANPIAALARAADKYGRGDFSAELPAVTSNDETGILTQAFYNMKVNLLELLKFQKENAKQEQKRASELDIASKIQASVLPVDFPKTSYFNIYAYMLPAKEVGGDFYDFFFINETHFAFLIADVSGKGIPAALFMMNAKSLLKSNLLSGYTLSEAAEKTNNDLCKTNNASMFLTAFIAVLNTETGEIEYVNAGHNPPLIRADNNYEYLRPPGNFVIAAAENFKYKSSSIHLKPNESIFLYTDGVVEAQNTKEEFFGAEKLINELNSLALEPKETILKIKKCVDDFSIGASQFDDITMLCVKYTNCSR